MEMTVTGIEGYSFQPRYVTFEVSSLLDLEELDFLFTIYQGNTEGFVAAD